MKRENLSSFLARGFLLSNDWFGCIVGVSVGDGGSVNSHINKRFVQSPNESLIRNVSIQDIVGRLERNQ